MFRNTHLGRESGKSGTCGTFHHCLQKAGSEANPSSTMKRRFEDMAGTTQWMNTFNWYLFWQVFGTWFRKFISLDKKTYYLEDTNTDHLEWNEARARLWEWDRALRSIQFNCRLSWISVMLPRRLEMYHRLVNMLEQRQYTGDLDGAYCHETCLVSPHVS